MQSHLALFLYIFLVFLLINFACSAYAAAPINSVVRVIDGDTVEIMGHKKPYRVRLSGIDAPEKGQMFGRKSKSILSNLIYRKIVRVETTGRDRYNRVLAKLFIGKKDINAEMVKRGAAWVYYQYTKDPVLYRAEKEARSKKSGLWAYRNPVKPWAWRKSER